MATLLNDNDVALQAAPYRDKTTLVTVVASATNFITAKNGGATTPGSVTLTATPNIVFTNAATFTWSYALNTAPTTWNAFDGALIQGTTTFTASGVSAAKAGTYVNLTQLSTTGTGSGLKLNIVKTGTGTDYSTITVTIVNPGVGYKVGDSVVISGAFLGGALTTNNLTLVLGGAVSSETGTNTKTITAETVNSLVGASKATSIQFRCAVSENFLDTAYGYALVTYSLEQANSDSVAIELTRSNAAVNTTVSGTPINFNNTGTTITVVRSGTQLAYNSSGGDTIAVSTPNSFSVQIVTDTSVDSTVPNRTVGTTSTTTTSWTLSGITALTADYATVTFLVTVYDASGYKSQSTYKTLSLNKVASGVNGEPAIVYYIDLSAPVIGKSTSSKFITGAHTQIKVYGKKTVGSGAFTTYGYITITGDGETEAATATLAVAAGITTNIADTSQNSVYTIRLYNMANRTDAAAVLLDTQIVPVVFNGANGITATITNDSATIPVTGTGTPVAGAYSNTGTLIRVYEGSEELTYDSSGTTKGTYTVTSSALNVTVGTITKVTGTIYATAGIVSTIAGDTASVTFTITGTSKGGVVFTISKIQTLNKSYPGTDARLWYLDISTAVISKDAGSSVIDGAHSVITITGKQTIGNAQPTTTGYITFTPTLALVSTSTGGVLKLSGVSSLVVNTPIIFSGTGIPSGITIGTAYFIKSINTTDRTITISATSGGATITAITNVSSIASVFAQSETTTATANQIITSIPNDVGAYSFTAKMYDTAAKTTLLDSELIPILFKGSNAVTAVLTNDSAVIPCDNAAAPISGAYANTGTAIRVYDGNTELTYDGNGQAAGTYTVSSAGTNITPGSIVASGIFASASIASAVTNNLSSIIFTITGKATNGTAISITKTQSFSKTIAGAPGAPGVAYKSAIITAYGWSNSATPPALTGTFNYNWTTGALSAGTGMTTIYPPGYAEVAGFSANNQTLHQIMLTISDVSTATTTSNIPWSGAKANKLGYREDGSIGPTGDAARTVYIVTTSATPPGIPTAGEGDVVPTSAAGTWSFQATSTLTSGQYMYQSDGTYKAADNVTTWRAPYLSNLKVGKLSAITADLGQITAGAMNIGSGKFVVDESGNVKIKGSGTGRMEITNENIKVYDSTGTLRVQLGNLDT
jgi:hypothetical protein